VEQPATIPKTIVIQRRMQICLITAIPPIFFVQLLRRTYLGIVPNH
jgi:hypothetical protein